MGAKPELPEDPFAPEALGHEVAVSFWRSAFLSYAVMLAAVLFLVALLAARGFEAGRLCFIGAFFAVTLIPGACMAGAFLCAIGGYEISASGIKTRWVFHKTAVDWRDVKSVDTVIPGVLLVIRTGDPWVMVPWPGHRVLGSASRLKELLEKLSPEDCPLRGKYP